MAEKGSNGKETAEAVGISASVLSRYLHLVNLAPISRHSSTAASWNGRKASLIAQQTADLTSSGDWPRRRSNDP